jgi:exopolyphosphatase/guanosine-5'-triphosphate,3'-diphosphate pyrophosphatase
MYGRSSVDGLAAALDLGSNSLHLIIARVDRGELVALERLKEKVQLGRGSTDGTMAAPRCNAASVRALRAIYGRSARSVSIVGTAARRSRDSFLACNRLLLRHPIRILTGEEEAG